MLARSAFRQCETCDVPLEGRRKRFCSKSCHDQWMRENTENRFWKTVSRSDEDQCWEWQGYRTNRGYGTTSFNGKQIRSHRLALILSGIEVPKNALVLHSCDNPPCCNPSHLRVGTALDNVLDMHRRGRVRHVRKLSDEDIQEIRAATGTLKEIASRFGVSFSHVGNIRKGNARVA